MTDDDHFSAGDTAARALPERGALAGRRWSAETLRRLERYEGALNAFVLYDPESAMAEARASEARWQKGEPRAFSTGFRSRSRTRF